MSDFSDKCDSTFVFYTHKLVDRKEYYEIWENSAIQIFPLHTTKFFAQPATTRTLSPIKKKGN